MLLVGLEEGFYGFPRAVNTQCFEGILFTVRHQGKETVKFLLLCTGWLIDNDRDLFAIVSYGEIFADLFLRSIREFR